MKGRWLFVLVGIVGGGSPALAQTPDAFAGVYAGGEFGAISYNTQITFDGVNDPAGRGGVGYNAFVGYGRAFDAWVLGAEAFVSGASVPDPYTFDPDVTGFSELDLRRGTGVGVDVRGGRLVGGHVLIHGILGYSVATQSVYLDGVPLSDFEGGSEPETFGTVQYGGGVEFAPLSRLGIRFAFRSLGGHDLSAEDFGSVTPDAGLTFFDVEPGQHQFMFGVRYRF